MSTTEPALAEISHDLLISRMSEHDLLEVVEIEEESGLSRWGWSAYYSELQGANRRFMLVARTRQEQSFADVRVAGYIVARLVTGEIHINNVAVRDLFRRRGIGAALLGQILQEAWRAKATVAFLEVRARNLAAQALYKRSGFRPVARRRDYYTAPLDDALIMRLTF